jgi:chitinase
VKNLDTTGAATELTRVNYAFTNLDPVNLTCLNGVVLGVSTNPDYGRGWQGVTDGGAHGEWQAANSAAPGQFAGEAGTRGHSNLIASVPGCTVYHDTQAVATYCYTGSQWWTFDDTWSIGQKMTWLKSKGLLGAMIWEMSGDTGTLMSAVDSGLR